MSKGTSPQVEVCAKTMVSSRGERDVAASGRLLKGEVGWVRVGPRAGGRWRRADKGAQCGAVKTISTWRDEVE